MKTVFTFAIITFAVSLFLWLGGATTDNEFNSFEMLQGLLTGGLANSTLWLVVFGFIGIMTATSLGTAFFGADASIGRALGFSALVVWFLTLIGDFIAIIGKASTGCSLAAGEICTVSYYVIWFFGLMITAGFIMAAVDLVGGND
jgi:hypothetical protein